MAWLTLMSRPALSVRVFAALEETASLTKMSPFPPLPPAFVWTVKLPPLKADWIVAGVTSVAPAMDPTDLISTSSGSRSQVPPPVATLTLLMSAHLPEVSTKPPLPRVPSPCADIRPPATISPLNCPASSTFATTDPPFMPSTAITLELSSSIFFVACRNIRPPSLTTLLAFSVPLFFTSTPAIPIRPASLAIVPRLVTFPSRPVISTFTPGVPVSMSPTVCPAARMTSPLGALISPLFSTAGPTR